MVGKGPCALATNVSKPEKHGSGRAAIVDYLITTSFDGDGEKSTTTAESLVRRTFEDFQWIQKRLVRERMGIIVPVLSNKKPAKNKDQFFESFITMRQESLDRFLQRAIHHPELVDAPCLLSFFTANPTDWNAAKETAQNDKDVLLKENTTTNNPGEDELAALDSIQIDAYAAMHSPTQAKNKGPMRRWFANKRTQWALQNENLILEETPAESKKFTDMKTYADHLEVCARILSEDYKEVLASNTILAEKTGSMGATFTQMWGEHELSNTSSSNLYQSLGQVWANVGKTVQNHVAFGQRYFENPVDDLVMDIVALQDALAKRKTALYTYTKFTQQGKMINNQLDKIRAAGNMTIQQDRYYKLETDLRHCDDKIEESRNHSDLVTSRLERDIERFRVEWHERMRQVLEVFHKRQIEVLQSQANDFSSVLPALATLDTKRSDLSAESSKPEKMEINVSFNSGGAKVAVGSIHSDQTESYPEQADDSNIAPVPAASAPVPAPVSPRAGELPPPTETTPYGDSPALQPIALNASFSSDDGFDAVSAMGGESSSNNEAVETSSRPIVKSV